MTTEELKQAILSTSLGGVMYDVGEHSSARKLVVNHEKTARELCKTINDDQSADGIEKGVANFIKEILETEKEKI